MRPLNMLFLLTTPSLSIALLMTLLMAPLSTNCSLVSYKRPIAALIKYDPSRHPVYLSIAGATTNKSQNIPIEKQYGEKVKNGRPFFKPSEILTFLNSTTLTNKSAVPLSYYFQKFYPKKDLSPLEAITINVERVSEILKSQKPGWLPLDDIIPLIAGQSTLNTQLLPQATNVITPAMIASMMLKISKTLIVKAYNDNDIILDTNERHNHLSIPFLVPQSDNANPLINVSSLLKKININLLKTENPLIPLTTFLQMTDDLIFTSIPIVSDQNMIKTLFINLNSFAKEINIFCKNHQQYELDINSQDESLSLTIANQPQNPGELILVPIKDFFSIISSSLEKTETQNKLVALMGKYKTLLNDFEQIRALITATSSTKEQDKKSEYYIPNWTFWNDPAQTNGPENLITKSLFLYMQLVDFIIKKITQLPLKASIKMNKLKAAIEAKIKTIRDTTIKRFKEKAKKNIRPTSREKSEFRDALWNEYLKEFFVTFMQQLIKEIKRDIDYQELLENVYDLLKEFLSEVLKNAQKPASQRQEEKVEKRKQKDERRKKATQEENNSEESSTDIERDKNVEHQAAKQEQGEPSTGEQGQGELSTGEQIAIEDATGLIATTVLYVKVTLLYLQQTALIGYEKAYEVMMIGMNEISKIINKILNNEQMSNEDLARAFAS